MRSIDHLEAKYKCRAAAFDTSPLSLMRRRRRRSGAINLQLTLLYFRVADKFLFAFGMVLLVHFPSKNINLQNIMWRKNKEILFSQSIYVIYLQNVLLSQVIWGEFLYLWRHHIFHYQILIYIK